jgi:inner membrane protease subunit 1
MAQHGWRQFANWKFIKESAKEYVFFTTGACSTVVCFSQNIATVTFCRGPSMEPTLPDSGKLAVVWKWNALGREYEKGDVVIAVSPLDSEKRKLFGYFLILTVFNIFILSSKEVCKRIVALDSDYVITRNGRYKELVQIPAGNVWLEGDNPNNSHDSRHYGAIPKGLLRGKVLCTIDFKAPFMHLLAARPENLRQKYEEDQRLIQRHTQTEEEITKRVEQRLREQQQQQQIEKERLSKEQQEKKGQNEEQEQPTASSPPSPHHQIASPTPMITISDTHHQQQQDNQSEEVKLEQIQKDSFLIKEPTSSDLLSGSTTSCERDTKE